jgi:cysteine-rich repeat protein
MLLLACSDQLAPVELRASACTRQEDCAGDLFCHDGFCLLNDHCAIDGRIAKGEACDDGNFADDDACLSNCALARCGDGIQRMDRTENQAGFEACDDGDDQNDNGCTNACLLARCGDGFTRQDQAPAQADFEACDDGDQDDTDACTNNCRFARCGDGNLRVDLALGEVGYEVCDDGNSDPYDGCTDHCVVAICGDGLQRGDLEAGAAGHEECDDGNQANDDGCTTTCRVNRCGDGVLRTDRIEGEPGYEGCDDGNLDNTDACLNTCRLAQCGDGVLRRDAQEGASDYEACDDGNAVDGDACRSHCQVARCGDGVVRRDLTEMSQEGFENCEPGQGGPGLFPCRRDCRTGKPPQRLALGVGAAVAVIDGQVWGWSLESLAPQTHTELRQPGHPSYVLGLANNPIGYRQQSFPAPICILPTSGWAQCVPFSMSIQVTSVPANPPPAALFIPGLLRLLAWQTSVYVSVGGSVFWWGTRPTYVVSDIEHRLEPSRLEGLSGIIDVVGFHTHGAHAALKHTGEVYWLNETVEPIHEGPIRDLIAGGDALYVVQANGDVAFRLLNSENGAWQELPVPGPVAELRRKYSNQGFVLQCVRLISGQVWCQGAGALGQLGNGTLQDSEAWVRAGDLDDVVELRISKTGLGVCARRQTGTFWCWGAAAANSTPRSSPTQVPGLPN